MFKKLINTQSRDFIKTSFGNILEWYDFTIYGLFAIGISKAFFNTESKFIALILVFATFAVGFLARPVGSIIFGLIGDKYGKHYAVNLSIWLMAVPTALIGLLPGYQQIGVAAPILLVILRICQGLSAGGQFSGLIAIAVDSNSTQRNFLVSLVYAISVIGCFVASFVGYISVVGVSYFNPVSDFSQSLMWRIPFLISALLFIIYLKLNPEFHKSEVNENALSLRQIFKRQPKELITMGIIGASGMSVYYLLFTYLVTFMQLYLHLAKDLSFLIMNGLLLLSIILYPSFGLIADRLTNRINSAQRMVFVFAVGIALFVASTYSLWFGIMGLIVMVVAYCAITSYTTSIFAEIFAPEYRMTACSFSFNIGVTVAGFAPLIAEVVSKLSVFGLSAFILFVTITLYYGLSLANKHLAHN
ncbi:MAG: MFS transporter [Burkholderiales bacterium]|nr:MFS transporter [Burkholderiales bacterium]